MPRVWHDQHAVNKIEDEEQKSFYRRIVADKKPYFMRYIYPSLMKQYNTYTKNAQWNCLKEFQMKLEVLLALPETELSNRQRDFIQYYKLGMPVGTSDCIMNKICRRFEEEFDGYLVRHNSNTNFDYTIMRSGSEYSTTQFRSIKRLYEEYNRRTQSYVLFVKTERIDSDEAAITLSMLHDEFRIECAKICSSRDILSDIILDICYTHNTTKMFAWGMCNEDIIRHLLIRNNYDITFPVRDVSGEIEYGGERFTMKTRKVEVEQ